MNQDELELGFYYSVKELKEMRKDIFWIGFFSGGIAASASFVALVYFAYYF